MIKIGQYNTLVVSRLVDFGAYLSDNINVERPNEVLLPARYISEPLSPGDNVHCFVYKDNEGRPVATTEHPYATVGEFAFLQVSQVNEIGTFLDWGLSKELLVPFREQKVKMIPGGIYPVYVYLDDVSQRVTATAKVEHYIGNVLPHYKRGDEVEALVLSHTDRGYRAVVDNLHWGMIYDNMIFKPVAIGDKIKAYVTNVREDGKIDLSLSGKTLDRISEVADEIERLAKASSDGQPPLNDSSSPEQIQELFNCSKKDFKKALGLLYKTGRLNKPVR